MSILHSTVKKKKTYKIRQPFTALNLTNRDFLEVKGEESEEGRKRWKKPPFASLVPTSAWNGKWTYRIYSINRPGRLLNFWTLRVGAYSRLGAY